MSLFFKLTSLAFLLCCSCSANHYYAKERTANIRFKKPAPKYSFSGGLNKPSESMQVGLPKSKFSRNGFYSSEEDRDSASGNLDKFSLEDSEENNQNISQEASSGHFKIGDTYSVFGVQYQPQDYEIFEETGMASWYGDEFNGKPTANGEIYNKGDITAAHRTLPLPSIIRATNLRNNKTLIVRVNDRGPFAKSRVIDFSEKSAELLGFKEQGITEVKIELLRAKTDEIVKNLMANSGKD